METSESTSLSEDILFLSSLYDIKFKEDNEEYCSNENDPLCFVIRVGNCSVQFCYSVSEDSLQAHVSMNDSQEGLEKMQRSVKQLVAVASIHWTKRVCSAIDRCKDYFQTREDLVVQPTEDTCGHPGPAHASPQLTSSSNSVCPRGGKGKKPPMKTALDVINRIKWDRALDPSLFTVAYEDRFSGIVEKEFSAFDWENDISSVGPEVLSVPQHRIQYFKYKNRVVWDKKRRVDHVFGSSGGRVDISRVIEEEEKENQAMDSELNLASLQLEQNPHPTPHSRKGRPNHFIGIRIGHPVIKCRVGSYQQSLLESMETHHKHELQQCMTRLCKLHVTLCVCELNSDSEVEKTKQVLQDLSRTIQQFKINFSNVANFNEAVLYAQPHCKELLQINLALMERLQQAEINLTANYDKFIQHLTIFKLGHAKKYLFTKIRPMLIRKKIKFGYQDITELVLCKFGKREVQEDGFYPVLKVATLCKEKLKQKCLKHSAASSGPSKRNPEQESREDLEGSLEESPFSAEIKGKESERKKRNRDVIIGKSLSAVLRHNKFGFKVDDEGYVEVDAILKHQHFRKLWVTREELYRLVDANDKQRFAIHVNKDGRELIKANQGHSVEVAALKLTPITEARDYPHVIHGTFWKSWSFIAKEGLSRRKRVHIHMTTAEPNSDQQVVSGMRYSCDVFVHVDMESALKDGIQFFLSENKVILSPGDEHGYILPKHFLKVEGISKGKRITLLDNTIKETTANDVTDSLPADVEADSRNESNESNPSIPQ